MSETPSDRRLRLLFLLSFAPRLDARHGGRAIAHLLRELGARHDVSVLHLRKRDDPPVDGAVKELCAAVGEVVLPRDPSGGRALSLARLVAGAVAGRPFQATELWSRAFAALVHERTLAWRPDVVHADMHAMAQYFAVLRGCPARKVLSAHELAPTREFFVAAGSFEAALRMLDAHAWRRFQRHVFAAADGIVTFTEEDAAAIRTLRESAAVTSIPLHLPPPERALDPKGSPPPRIVFVGGLGHPPNLDAAIRLATSILPRIRERAPATMLDIVGPAAPETLRRVAGAGVTVAGEVPDVTPFLDRAAVFVAPLRLGGGMRVKLLEALAAGKAVVASQVAVRGLDVVDGTHVMLADGDQEIADAIVLLLGDPHRRVELARAARLWATSRFAQRRTLSAYEDVYARACAPR